jgi:hypothetical protein
MIAPGKTTVFALLRSSKGHFMFEIGRTVLAPAVSLLLLSLPVQALDIKQSKNETTNTITLELTGKFDPGDGLRLRAEVAKLPPEATIVVHLNAGGGPFVEGMSVGRLIHQLGIKTVIPPKAKCVSPCPLAFFGGSDPKGGAALVKHTTASFGFTPFLANAPDRDYTAKDLDAEVEKTQQSILKVFDYLAEVGADFDILRRIYDDIPDGQARYVSDEDLLSLGVSIFDDKTNQLIDASAIRKRAQR